MHISDTTVYPVNTLVPKTYILWLFCSKKISETLYILSILLFLILTSCGFKIVNYSSLSNFEIAEITTSGERKINYRVKNKLLQNSNKGSDKLILIKIETERDKSIKEKNIKKCSLEEYINFSGAELVLKNECKI